MDLLKQITPFMVIAYATQCIWLIIAIVHYVEYRYLRKKLASNWSDFEHWKPSTTLIQEPSWSIWVGDLIELKHPIPECLCWLFKKPSVRFVSTINMHTIMLERIDAYLNPLSEAVNSNKSIAPISGFLFTTIGIMLATQQMAHSQSIHSLMNSIGPALGTTALGAITSMIEIWIQKNGMIPIKSRLKTHANLTLIEFSELYKSVKNAHQPDKTTSKAGDTHVPSTVTN